MTRKLRSGWYRYGLAVAAVAAAVLARAALDPVLGAHAPLILFLLPVMIAALFAGARAGLLATLLGGVAGFTLFVTPRGELFSYLPVDLVRAVLFFGEGALVSVLVGSRRRGWEAAADIAADLRENASRGSVAGRWNCAHSGSTWSKSSSRPSRKAVAPSMIAATG